MSDTSGSSGESWLHGLWPRGAWQRVRHIAAYEQVLLFTLSLLIGAAAGAGAIVFYELIYLFQGVAFGSTSPFLVSVVEAMPWWAVIAAPTAGGLGVGLFLRFVMPARRPVGVADVIEASALRAGHMSLKAGLAGALVNAASIGAGASVGREGPVVHIGATLGGWLAHKLRLGRSMSRTLLGCGVAAAIAASFNAPIAGVFFALEVVIGHYALSAFAPVVLAAVIGTIASRMWFGDYPAFIVPSHEIVSFLEIPAFALLGVACAVQAIVLMRSIALVSRAAERLPMPVWLRPAIAGALVGAIGIAAPEVLGVGYEATDTAIRGGFAFDVLLVLVVAKTAATAISLGGGFGGGIFSPSLFLGAMLGGLFGLVAQIPFPDLHSGIGAYTLIGMGAVSAAVLAAPISTILIIFELTNDYELTIAVMIATVIATALTRGVHGFSFFTWQLARRNIKLHGGHEVAVLRDLRVRDVMRTDHVTVTEDAGIQDIRARLVRAPMGELFEVTADGRLVGIITLADVGEQAFDLECGDVCADEVARHDPPILTPADSLEAARAMFSRYEEGLLPVVDNAQHRHLVGCIDERDLMRAYNRALERLRREEHGEL